MGQGASKPNWIKDFTYTEDSLVDQNPGYQYLLLDNQENLERQIDYWHFVIKVTNNEGVQSMSNISVDYDPSYQTIDFHQVNVYRKGKKVNRLKKGLFEKVRRETNMERSLYDGSETVYANLSDIRPGDIIEYSYSLTGYNPVKEGFYSKSVSLEYAGIPVNRIVFRLLKSKSRKLNYKLINGAEEPIIKSNGQLDEYLWDTPANKTIVFDSYVPQSYNPLKYVSLSTFQDWGEVVRWASELYKYPEDELNKIDLNYPRNASLNYKIQHAIQFVQDDIRYLGLESGIGAYKPNSPIKVYGQRFGDCKDKSLLLVALLRQLGVESNPMLVNTTLKSGITDYLPGSNLFDHCVVAYEFEGQQLYVDPTISNQGGGILNRVFPNYQVGLVLKNKESDLRNIELKYESEVEVKEWFVLDSINGGGELNVRTEYRGSRADDMRSQFASSSAAAITKSYLDFYSSLYPKITASNNVRLVDSSRLDENLLITEEKYIISEIWNEQEGLNYIYMEIYPLLLESLITFGDVASPTMPYDMGQPTKFKQTSVVEMPEQWEVSTMSEDVSGEGYSYRNSLSSDGKVVTVIHEYESKNGVIDPSKVTKVLRDHEKIQAELNYILTYDPESNTFNLSFYSVFLSLLGFVLGLLIVRRVNNNYQPNPRHVKWNQSIRGWLILPAIGLVLTIFRIGFDTFSVDFFSKAVWLNIGQLTENALIGKAIFSADLVYNVGLLVFLIYLSYQFFTRKTRTPMLMKVYFIIGFLIPLIDYLLVITYFPDLLTAQESNVTIRALLRSAVAAAIWVPYFHVSKRVKETFTVVDKNHVNDDLGSIDNSI